MAKRIDDNEITSLDISTAGNVIRAPTGLHTKMVAPMVNASKKITKNAVKTMQNTISEISDNGITSIAVVNSNGKQSRSSGVGKIEGFLDNKKVGALLEENLNLKKSLEEARKLLDQQSWSDIELALYTSVFLNDFNPSKAYQDIYNNDIYDKKLTIVEKESIIRSIPPVLSYYSVACSPGQWCSMYHVSGTVPILQKMFPLHSFSIENVFMNANKDLKGLQMKMTSRVFPKDNVWMYGTPGKTGESSKFASGSKEKLTETYAEKFANCFECLKTIKLIPTEDTKKRAADMLHALNSYKACYYDIVYPYSRFYFNLVLDTIGHYYLSKGLLPKSLTLEHLLTAFPPEDMIQTDLFLSKEEALKSGIPPYIVNLYVFPRDYYYAHLIMESKVAEAYRAKLLPEGVEALPNKGSYASTFIDNRRHNFKAIRTFEEKKNAFMLKYKASNSDRMIDFDMSKEVETETIKKMRETNKKLMEQLDLMNKPNELGKDEQNQMDNGGDIKNSEKTKALLNEKIEKIKKMIATDEELKDFAQNQSLYESIGNPMDLLTTEYIESTTPSIDAAAVVANTDITKDDKPASKGPSKILGKKLLTKKLN